MGRVIEMAPVAFDRYLQERLQGARLVGEIPPEGEAFERADEIVGALAPCEAAIATFACIHPALFAYYLTAQAARNGDGGEFWTFIPWAKGDGNRQSAAGESYLQALRKLRLPTFDHLVVAGARRYLTPILLHAMLTRPSCGRLLGLMAEEAGHGARSGQELIARWRADRNVIGQLAVPTQRFFTEGDRLAVDVLDRLLEFTIHRLAGGAEPSDPFGLPHFVGVEFDRLGLRRPNHLVAGVPPPALQLDPWADAPNLLLPATPLLAEWLISTDGEQERRRASLSDTVVEIEPARTIRVEGLSSQGEMLTRRTFELDDRVLAFHPARFDIVPAGSEIDTADVIVWRPAAVTLHLEGPAGSKPRVIQEYAEPFGKWSGYACERIALADAHSLWRVDGEGSPVERRLLGARGSERLGLFGTAVKGLTDAAGRPVFDAMPMLDVPASIIDLASVKVRVSSGDTAQTAAADQLPEPYPGVRRLDGLVARGHVGPVSIAAVGPLGSDLRVDICVIPDVLFDRPDCIVQPAESVETTIAVGPSAQALEFGPGCEARDLALNTGERSIDVVARIPRLLWTISQDGQTAPSFQHEIISLDSRDFDASGAAIMVRTGVPVDLRLRLVDAAGSTLQQGDWCSSGKEIGRWREGLQRFADTVREHGDAGVQFVLESRAFEIPVVAIGRPYTCHHLECAVSEAEPRSIVFDRYEASGPSERLRVELWPVHLPFAQPTILGSSSIRNEGLGSRARFVIPEDVPPGEYLLRLADRHQPLNRPLISDPATAGVTLAKSHGHAADAAASIQGPALDRFLAGDLRASHLTPADRRLALARAAAMVLTLTRPVPDSDPAIEIAVERLFDEDLLDEPWGHLLALIEATHHHASGPDTRAALGVQLITTALDCGIDEAPERVMRDLWESNRIFAAAIDRPGISGIPGSHARWRRHTGWSPNQKIPGQRPEVDPTLERLRHKELAARMASRRQRAIRLLHDAFFEVAQLEWLLAMYARRDELAEWIYRYSPLPQTMRSLPKDAQRLVGAMSSGELVAQVPRTITAAACHATCFDGRDQLGREALRSASAFAPLMVQRQSIIALLSHQREARIIKF